MNENAYRPRNLRIVRHITKNRILDIQDCLDIGKLRVEIVDFVEGQGAKLSLEHFAEPDALALVCFDILHGRPFEKYVEFKGTPQGESAVSRVLVVERVEARNPFKITISRGPGKLMETGAIQPAGKPEATLSMLLSEFDARRIAFTILRHLTAFEAATYHARVAAGTRRPEGEPAAPAGPGAGEPESRQAQPPASPEAPVAEKVPARAEAAPAATRPPTGQPRPAPRRAPSVESYWMAAERLGVTKQEAEGILQRVDGDWGRAWSALRAIEQRRVEARS